MKKVCRKMVCWLIAGLLIFSMLQQFTPAAKVEAATTIGEINIIVELSPITAGVLPKEITMSTENDRVKEIKLQNWIKRSSSLNEWVHFGNSEPIAVNDGSTRYGIAIKVSTELGYQLGPNTRVYVNNAPLDSEKYTVSGLSWGGYIDLDLGLASGENIETNNVTFMDRGNKYTVSNVSHGGYLPFIRDPEYDGHAFLGWYEDEKCEKKFDSKNTPITEDMTLYAGWVELKPVTEIRFKSDTVAAFTGNLTPFSVTTTNEEVESIASFGYGQKNSRWCKRPYGAGSWTPIVNSTQQVVGDGMTLYAMSIKVNLKPGYYFGDNVKVYLNDEDYSPSFYKMSVIEADPSWGGYVIIDLGVAKNPPPYTITFDTQGGSLDTASMDTNEKGKLTAIPGPVKTNASFKGWFTDPEGGIRITEDYIFSYDMTIYAQWGDPVYYHISFESNGGSEVTTRRVMHGYKLIKPKDPVREGSGDFIYEFDGWYLDSELTSPYNFDKLVEGPFELYAKWNVFKNCEFVDVTKDDFFYDAVRWAVSTDPAITSGVDDTHFKPYNICNRAQMITFLWRSVGCPEPQGTENPFTDVSEKDFYYKPVLWARENGITSGKTATEFAPLLPCTRGQYIVFLWRMCGKETFDEVENPFRDVKPASEMESAIKWALNYSITSGITQTKYKPLSNINRAQAVTFLYRARNVIGE